MIAGVVLDTQGNAPRYPLVVFAVPVDAVRSPPSAEHDAALAPVVVPPDADALWSDDTGVAGEFRIPDLPPGEYRLATKTLLWAVDPPVTARAGGPPARVRVVPAIGVSATVRDADDGSAISNFKVAIRLKVPGRRRVDLHAIGIPDPRWRVPDWVERSDGDAALLPGDPWTRKEVAHVDITVRADGFLAFERSYWAAEIFRREGDRTSLLPGATKLTVWLRRNRPANLEIQARSGDRPFIGDLVATYRFTVQHYVHTESFQLRRAGDGLFRGVLPIGKIEISVGPRFGLPGNPIVLQATIQEGKKSTVRLSLPRYGSLRVRLPKPPDGAILLASRPSTAGSAAQLRPIHLQWKDTLILNVLPGRWNLMVMRPKAPTHVATVEVVADKEAVLDVP